MCVCVCVGIDALSFIYLFILVLQSHFLYVSLFICPTNNRTNKQGGGLMNDSVKKWWPKAVAAVADTDQTTLDLQGVCVCVFSFATVNTIGKCETRVFEYHITIV